MTRTCVEPLERRMLLSVVPAGFAQVTHAAGLTRPTAMEFAPDGRLFVAEQGGNLRVIKNGQLLPTPFVSLPAQSSGERGLLGVAFDPNFQANGYVYVYWTAQSPTVHNRVTRFTASGDTAVPNSGVNLLDLPTLSATNHNGGAIHFGADGKLYVGVGENANGTLSQRIDGEYGTFGKMLRINPDGSIPTDNPFYNQTTGINRAVWATGLRNPYTFAVQPGTGRIFINDVGQSTFEEINEGRAGANYGWPQTEGPVGNNAQLTGPVHHYGRADGSCSITGGAFYNPAGSASRPFGAAYTGDYFFADYCGGYIKRLDLTNGQNTVSTFATNLPQPVDLKVGPDGSLYGLVRGASAGSGEGQVLRFDATASAAPTIGAQPAARTVPVGGSATFSVTASGTGPLAYQWQRNGTNIPGATASTYTLTNAQASDNNAQFRVVVSNAAGSVTSNAAGLTVSASQPPAATITLPAAGTTYKGGDTFNFAGTATDPEDGVLPASAYTWEVVFHHADHTHPHVAPFGNTTQGSFEVPTTGETAADVFYRIHLTVTDSSGLSTEVTRDVTPRTSNLTLATNVPGLRLELDGVPVTGPTTVLGVEGIDRAVSAPATQTLNGTTYAFVGWSDNGAATHTVSTPAQDTTLTAEYRATVGVGPGADLAPTFVTAPPGLVVGGDRGRMKVRVANTGDDPFAGPVAIRLLLSSDGTADPGDAEVTAVTRNMKLKAGKAKAVNLKFAYPAVPDGSYVMLAQVTPGTGATPDADPANNVFASPPLLARAPAVDLSGTFRTPTPASATRGGRGTVTLDVLNGGNVIARGPAAFTLFASTDSTGGSGTTELRTITRNVKIKPGARLALRVPFTVPADLPPGTYFFTAALDAAGQVTESEEANNLVVAATPVTVT